MEIKIKKSEESLYVSVIGSLNTKTAPDLETKLNENEEGIKEIILDFAELEYISSAGLRVILAIQNKMDEIEGRLVIRNAGEAIMDVFEMTGFTALLTLE